MYLSRHLHLQSDIQIQKWQSGERIMRKKERELKLPKGTVSECGLNGEKSRCEVGMNNWKPNPAIFKAWKTAGTVSCGQVCLTLNYNWVNIVFTWHAVILLSANLTVIFLLNGMGFQCWIRGSSSSLTVRVHYSRAGVDARVGHCGSVNARFHWKRIGSRRPAPPAPL